MFLAKNFGITISWNQPRKKELYSLWLKKKNKNNSKTEETDKSLLGQNAIFTPDVINDIHIKAQLGRYRMRGMALMKKIPNFDDLVFLPGTLTRFCNRRL